MKRQIAWWLVASLALPSGAAAQGGREKTPEPVVSRQWCWSIEGFADVPYTSEVWITMSQEARSVACAKGVINEWGKKLTPPETTRMRSPTMVKVGFAMTVAGLIVMAKPGKTVNVIGEEFCVTESSVQTGSCGRGPNAMTAGVVLIGGGIALAAVGLKDVQIAPLLGSVTGAQATVTWGGKK